MLPLPEAEGGRRARDVGQGVGSCRRKEGNHTCQRQPRRSSSAPFSRTTRCASACMGVHRSRGVSVAWTGAGCRSPPLANHPSLHLGYRAGSLAGASSPLAKAHTPETKPGEVRENTHLFPAAEESQEALDWPFELARQKLSWCRFEFWGLGLPSCSVSEPGEIRREREREEDQKREERSEQG